jgi:CDP-glucose 4,6-dehydratase
VEVKPTLEGLERLMFGDIFKAKNVIVTGNTGFKGSWLTVWLLKLGAKVYGVSKDIPTDPSLFSALGLSDKMVYLEEDIRSLDKTARIIGDIKPDFLFHLAAQPIVSLSYRDPIETITSNVIGTANVLEGLRRSNHRCAAVIITSDKCYDNEEWVWGYREIDKLGGKDIYSGSKGAAELIIKSYYYSFLEKSNVRVASARAGNVIGGGDWAVDRIVPDCMRAWSKKEKVVIRSPYSTRPWQHVLEPLSGYLALAKALAEDKKVNGEGFNFGPPAENSHTVRQLLEDMGKFWDFTDVSKSCIITTSNGFSESGLLKLNCDKALHYLEWLPTLTYGEMIEYVSAWYFKFYHENQGDLYEFTMEQISRYENTASAKGLSWTR